MPKAVLTISSRNYGAWALRGWLMAKLAKLAGAPTSSAAGLENLQPREQIGMIIG